jgi:hypothetical protein
LRDGHDRGKLINSLAAGPDDILASAGDDHAVVLWNLDWQAVACDIVGRDITDEEWKDYVGDGRRRDLCPDKYERRLHK